MEDTLKWMVYKAKSYKSRWFGGNPLSGNLHIDSVGKHWDPFLVMFPTSIRSAKGRVVTSFNFSCGRRNNFEWNPSILKEIIFLWVKLTDPEDMGGQIFFKWWGMKKWKYDLERRPFDPFLSTMTKVGCSQSRSQFLVALSIPPWSSM